MRLEPRQELACARLVVGMGPDPCIDKRADQPDLYRPLMMGRVARPQIAEMSEVSNA